MSDYDKTAMVQVPADFNGKTIDEKVIADVVEEALKTGPCVVHNHVHGAFNTFSFEDRHGTENTYEAAIRLAGIALRYAWEHRKR